MAQIKGQLCHFPESSWVHGVYLTCDNQLAIQYKHGVHRIHGIAVGGWPSVTCLYPAAPGLNFYDLLLVWRSQGRFVWHVLPYRQPYRLVNPPQLPCAGCATTVSVTTSGTPSTSGASVTFTATVTNTDGTAPPLGTVSFTSSRDGALGSGTALGASNPATSTFTTTSLSAGTHTITATFTPLTGFVAAQGTVTQVVNAATVSQCGCNVPQSLTATFTGGLTGSIPIAWDGTGWTGDGAPCGTALKTQVQMRCAGGTTWVCQLTNLGGGCGTGTTGASSGSCSPFSQTFNFTGNVSTCCSGVGFTVTVTT